MIPAAGHREHREPDTCRLPLFWRKIAGSDRLPTPGLFVCPRPWDSYLFERGSFRLRGPGLVERRTNKEWP
jgi:hypothetical protein